MGGGPAETKRQMESIGIWILEDVESSKNLRHILGAGFLLLLEVSGRERKILFPGKEKFEKVEGVHPAPGEVCSGRGVVLFPWVQKQADQSLDGWEGSHRRSRFYFLPEAGVVGEGEGVCAQG